MAVVVGVLAPATHSRGGEQKNEGASQSTQRSFWGVTDAAYVRMVLKWLVGGGKFGDG